MKGLILIIPKKKKKKGKSKSHYAPSKCHQLNNMDDYYVQKEETYKLYFGDHDRQQSFGFH